LLQQTLASVRDPYDRAIDARFINRELSWLDFNARVLTLATDHAVPLLERCRFVSIFSSNLDEFFQIRVAAMKDQVAGGIVAPTPDGRTPARQLRDIARRTQELVEEQERLFVDVLRPALLGAGIEIVDFDSLTAHERDVMADVFDSRIFPVLTPLAVDPAHPFPYISNLALNLAVMVSDPEVRDRRFARVKIPPNFPRFLQLPESLRFVPVEDVVRANLGRLFPGMTIEQSHAFRVTRNADLSLDDEDAEDLLAAVEMELRRRRFGRAVRLEVQANISDEILQLLLEELELGDADVTRHETFIDLTALNQLTAVDRPDLKFVPWSPQVACRQRRSQVARCSR
jgi:polyphosphate kinase